MKTKKNWIGIWIGVGFVFSHSLVAEPAIGIDLVSRYVWRGLGIGQSACIQPVVSVGAGPLGFDVWGSYAFTSGGFDEIDFTASWRFGSFVMRVTDYTYPEAGRFFDFRDRAGVHYLEIGLGLVRGRWDFFLGRFFSGDPDRSIYFEGAWRGIQKEDRSFRVVSGIGNGMYARSRKPAFHVGLTGEKGPLMVSYILNLDRETTYLVAGYRF